MAGMGGYFYGPPNRDMSKITTILIPGIHSVPFGADNWHNRAEVALQDRGLNAITHGYKQFAIRSGIKQRRVAKELVKRIISLNKSGHTIDLIAHSNGCAVVCRALRDRRVKVRNAFLLWGACWESWNRNGLNKAMFEDRVEQVYCFCSRRDWVVGKLGGLTSWLQFIGLGYGRLSYTGPKEVLSSLVSHVTTVWRDEWGHCSFQSEENLPTFLETQIIPLIEYG